MSVQVILEFLLRESVQAGIVVGTLVAAIFAAWFAHRTYRLKSGIDIRGTFGVASSIYSQDAYVHSVTLENMKDRAVIIFKVFLELGYGYYIELESREDDPLILGPFGAFKASYDPIDMYSVNMRRIRLDEMLQDRKVRRRLVVSTSHGRYNVRRSLQRWDPLADFFDNHLTAVIRPLRSTYRGKAYGSGTKYIVRVVMDGGKEEVIPIHPRDHEGRRFKRFRLTKEALASRDALESFLIERAVAGDLPCSDLEVLDLEEWRSRLYDRDITETIEAVPRGWFIYRIVGRVITIYDNWKLKRENRKRRRDRKREGKTGER